MIMMPTAGLSHRCSSQARQTSGTPHRRRGGAHQARCLQPQVGAAIDAVTAGWSIRSEATLDRPDLRDV